MRLNARQLFAPERMTEGVPTVCVVVGCVWTSAPCVCFVLLVPIKLLKEREREREREKTQKEKKRMSVENNRKRFHSLSGLNQTTELNTKRS